MKLYKSLTAGALALACVGSSYAADTTAAAVKLNITGATAFRLSVHAAIVQSLDNAQVAFDGTDLGGATHASFYGTVKNLTGVPTALVGKTALIKTSWNGSAAGIQAVTQTKIDGIAKPVKLAFIDGQLTQTSGTVAVSISGVSPQVASYTTTGTVVSGQTAGVNESADVVFSDVHQSNTIFAAGTQNYSQTQAEYDLGTTHAYEFSALSEQNAGVVVFAWLRSNSASTTLQTELAKFNNIDSWKAQQILQNGSLPLSFFTGVAADSGYSVYVTGRNADSGTRVTTLAEAGYVGDPFHYLATVGSGSISDVSIWPASTVQGVFFPIATGGESSGGTLVNKIKQNLASATATVNGAGSSAITVITTAGIADIVAKGAQAFEINWNGTPYSDEAVRNGQYTFWGYEQAGYLTTYSGNGRTYADYLVAKRIAPVTTGTAEVSGVSIDSMKVTRGDIGLVVTPL